MNDQPTPETNAFFATFADGECEPSHAEYYFRMQDLERERDFERKLNTQIMEGNTRITKERDKALRDVEKAKSCKKALKNENNKLRRERDEAQNEIIGWRNKWDCAIEMAARAENALDEMTLRWEQTNDALFDERALSDQLADALRDFLNSHLVDAALTAWKEARK